MADLNNMDIVDKTTLDLLPEKSKTKYINCYNRFKKWCETNNAPDIVQDIVLNYFQQRAKKLAPSSLWSEYIMIKSLILIERGVDIGKFTKLLYFLKRNYVNYRPKKSYVITQEDMFKFVSTADDKKYLMKKVVLLMGIAGAMRMDELCRMTTNDIREENGIFNVIIPTFKNNTSRQFVLKGVYKDINFVDVVKKYLDCRPATGSNRLFLRYVNGSCSNRPLGINTLSKIPSEVAKYLQLPDAHLYTGHCFRRLSATILMDNVGDIPTLKRLGAWESTTVAESYINDSNLNRNQIANLLFGASSSTATVVSSQVTETLNQLNFNNCNVTINFNGMSK